MPQRADSRLSVRFGDEVLQRGHTAVPNLVLNYYARLGITPAEMLFTIHVWQHWWTERDPHPSLRTVAVKMGLSARQAKRYVEALERKGFLRVVERFAPHGGQLTNEFDYSPLIRAVVQAARADGALAARASGIARRVRQRAGGVTADILPWDGADTGPGDEGDTGATVGPVAPGDAPPSPEEAWTKDAIEIDLASCTPPSIMNDTRAVHKRPLADVPGGMTLPQVWAAVLATLAPEVAAAEVDAWLRPARLVAWQAGAAVLVAPSTVACRQIVRRYGARLRAALAALAGEPVALSCVSEVAWRAAQDPGSSPGEG